MHLRQQACSHDADGARILEGSRPREIRGYGLRTTRGFCQEIVEVFNERAGVMQGDVETCRRSSTLSHDLAGR